MEDILISPANTIVLGLPGWFLFTVIPLIGIGAFIYILARRMIPLAKGAPDPRLDRFGERIKFVVQYWLGQYKQPRYMLAGVLHILIFAGFLILSLRTLALVFVGFSDGFEIPGFGG